MSLISVSFVIFLPLTVFINFMLPKKQRYIWLFLASYVFYLSNDVGYGAGLLFCTASTYGTGLLLKGKSSGGKKVLLGICVAVNAAVLLLFRHSFFGSAAAPIGISFYMLQAVGYVIDVYRGQIPAERNPLKYAVFVSFFPTVISGPIQRAGRLLPQIREGRDFDYKKAHAGLYYLLWGYLLKLAMADRLGIMVNLAYDNYQTMPGATLLWANVLYAVQLYCDFAGYSALAIGAAKLMGFDIDINFSQPYFAVSVRDFWNRWHISLSSWLRDYVYIPLGGNRKGKCRKYVNLLITFLFSGLWHGSGTSFLAWGFLHGIYQIVGDAAAGKGKQRRDASKNGEGKEKKTHMAGRVAGMLVTFLLVDFAWIFFRAESIDQAAGIISRILFHFDFHGMTYYGSYLLGGTKLGLLFMLAGIAVVFCVDALHEKKISIEHMMSRINVAVRWVLYIALTMLLLTMIVRNYGQAASTFIYEKF